jgi:protein arginine kinase activator
MKCQKCENSATFHITDLTGDDLLALHLCADCAKEYLQTDQGPVDSAPESAPTMTGTLNDQLQLEQTADDLRELDSKKCPICGISFYEFRHAGRLGCPHDYVFFGEELEPLLVNVHGHAEHTGKSPKRGVCDAESQTQLIRLRREMREVVEQEDYERATELRDQIRSIENGTRPTAGGEPVGGSADGSAREGEQDQAGGSQS